MDMFSALAEPTRRSIVELLASRGQLSASEIFSTFPVSAPAVSQHLKVLRDSSIVTVEKRAQKRLYSINPAKISEVEAWAKKMKLLWNDRFDRLDRVVTTASAHAGKGRLI